jgi:hypothetical protein
MFASGETSTPSMTTSSWRETLTVTTPSSPTSASPWRALGLVST